MENTKYFLIQEIKIKKAWFCGKMHLIITFMLISSSISLSVFYSFRNEENLVALLVYSSLRRVAASGNRNHFVATSSISWTRQAVFKMRSEYGVTPYPAQHCSTLKLQESKWCHQTSRDGTRTERIIFPSVKFTAKKLRYF